MFSIKLKQVRFIETKTHKDSGDEIFAKNIGEVKKQASKKANNTLTNQLFVYLKPNNLGFTQRTKYSRFKLCLFKWCFFKKFDYLPVFYS